MATAKMREVPMREQVERYLHRLRYTLPFPCSLTDMYFGCMPLPIEQWYKEGLFKSDVSTLPPNRMGNLLNTLHSQSMMAEGDAILHVSADSKAAYIQAMKGVCGFERVFWFRPPLGTPLPHNSLSTPFFLNDDHPYREAITVWLDRARALEQEIQKALRLMELYSKMVTTYAQVHHTWPELLHFVRFKHMVTPARDSVSLKQAAARMLRLHDKEGTIEMLATAVMLPEKNPDLPAWVNFFTGEHHGF